jgi:hypothetical protein
MKFSSIEESQLLKRKIKAFKLYSDDLEIRKFDESEINIFDFKKAV